MFGQSFITDSWIITFIYILLRFIGMIIVSPIFGRRNVPPLLRMGFCLLMSIIVMMILPKSQYAASSSYFDLFFNGVKEVALGMLMGFISYMALSVAIAAGQLIDMQIGFGMANFFDPSIGMQMALTSNFLNILIMLVFFVTNSHHKLIQLMFSSFQMISPGNVEFGLKAIEMMFLYFTWFIILIVKVTLPIIAVTTIIEVGLGVIVKTMPQMNMFVVGIPLKLVMGIIILILFLSAFVFIMEGAFDQMFDWHEKIIQGLIVK